MTAYAPARHRAAVPAPVPRTGTRPGAGQWWPLAAVAVVNVVIVVGVLSPIRAVVVFPLVILLPGHLTRRLARIHRPSGPDRLLHTVAFGVLWLIGISFLLGLLGALRPVWCLAAFDAVTLTLGVATVLRDGTAGARPRLPRRPVRPLEATAVVLAALAVVLAATGARQLTAGGSYALTAAGFTIGTLAVVLLVIAAGVRAHRDVLPAAAAVVYLLGLAMLLATSLRGVGVTGHDIKPEFRVFQDTLTSGQWHPDVVLADYNACLSITTLPTLLHHLLGIAPLDVFRVGNQVLFALVPVAVLLVARTLLPMATATLAAVLYVAFPTFVNDMPMLNRQEIALLFFAVAVLTLVDGRSSRRQRTTIFAAMVAGMTVSHYSTTYVAGGVLFVAWLLAAAVRLIRRPESPIRARLRAYASPLVQPRGGNGPSLLTWRAVAIVVACAAVWSLTSGSGAGLVGTVRDTVAAVASAGGTESDAVGYSFLRSGPPVSDRQALGEFTTTHGSQPDATEQAGIAATCPVVLEPEPVLTRTPAGTALAEAGLPPAAVNRWWRQLTVVLYEGGALVGLVLLWLFSRRDGGPARILAIIGAGMLTALAGTVVLPQISVDYGLLRLFQQSLVVLAPAVMLAVAAGARPLGPRAAAVVGAFVVTGCLISTSGLVPRLTGDFPAQLNLANTGAYHRAYLTGEDDLATARWVGDHLPAGALLSADSADFRTLRATTRLYPLEGVAPGMVPDAAYLQVSTVGPDRAEAVAITRDRILTYTFRLSCVTRGRPLLFQTGSHRVYGPAS
ncbi:hypothetical protein [Krasilnikovia sp. MM14-A1259]|uniref:hypothetical protein n=1 Tax=Krasilnikovia sp. MM14-A1259 TaxID=3373539 RepID=UPI0038207514